MIRCTVPTQHRKVRRTTSTQHVPGDVGAQKLWLVNRRPKEWRDKVDVSYQVGPEMTAAEARDDLIQFLVEHGVIAPPPPLIEGDSETVGETRIAGPAEQGEQGDKIDRRVPRPLRRARL